MIQVSKKCEASLQVVLLLLLLRMVMIGGSAAAAALLCRGIDAGGTFLAGAAGQDEGEAGEAAAVEEEAEGQALATDPFFSCGFLQVARHCWSAGE